MDAMGHHLACQTTDGGCKHCASKQPDKTVTETTQPRALHSLASVCGAISQAGSSTSMWIRCGGSHRHQNDRRGVARAGRSTQHLGDKNPSETRKGISHPFVGASPQEGLRYVCICTKKHEQREHRTLQKEIRTIRIRMLATPGHTFVQALQKQCQCVSVIGDRNTVSK